MYDLINASIRVILDSIPARHVTEYDYLIQNVDQCMVEKYRHRYRNYWRLNRARLCNDYLDVYFHTLQASIQHFPNIGNLVRNLYNKPMTNGGRHSLQFSFATKLLHTVNRNAPIYDSRVAAFYFFSEPSSRLELNQRIGAYSAFYDFLVHEYARILENELLHQSIHEFRQRFNPQQFTDVKIIDSLIWTYVSFLQNGGIINRVVNYH